MNQFLQFIQNYGALINIGLVATLFGILLRIIVMWKSAVVTSHQAKVHTKETEIVAFKAEIGALKTRMESKEEQFKAKTDLLEHQLSFFQKISDLPDDKRFEALKHEYESKLIKLQGKLEAQAKAQPEDAENLKAVIKELKSEEGRYFKIEKSKIWEMASKLVEFTVKYGI